MAANTARNGQPAGQDMGFEEAEIRRRMGEIADWLKSQEPAAPPPPPPQAPKLQVVASKPRADDGSLDGIMQRRMAVRRERDDAEPESDSDSMRQVMGRFSGPIHSAESRRSLSAAVAEIVERQRRLEASERYENHDIGSVEAAFDRIARQFERRAERTFEALESSLAEVSGLMRATQSGGAVNQRIEELARELAELRGEATDSERRTRELLDVVRQTLEHVATRLPERTGAAAPVQANPSVRARAAAMRAQQETAAASEETEHQAHASPERRQFIAAARRSAQTPEPTARYQQASRAYPIEAARPSTVKRTLLAGAAAAALLFGIYAGSSRFLDGIFNHAPQTAHTTPAEIAPPPAPASAPETYTAAVAPPPAPVPPAPAPAPVFTPPEYAPAPIAPPYEPVVTGSVPQQAEPASEPLPIEIGGPRLRTRAIGGDPNAQYEVAMRYAEGRGVTRDMTKAATWMERAANQGLAPAQYRFANMAEKGNGVTKDLQMARRLYEQAAAAGNVQAMHNLGVMHAEGGLGAPDMAVALVWFRKAADFGVKDSQFNLGIFYARGLSVPQDLNQSYLWFTLAAAQGDKDAMSKRDQIGAKLGADKVAAAKVSADTWKPKAAPVEANEVTPPPEGWDTAQQARAN